MRASQLRFWFASFAYVLMCALRRLALAGSELAQATCGSIRLKLLKIGAQITVSARRVKIALASSYPLQGLRSGGVGRSQAAARLCRVCGASRVSREVLLDNARALVTAHDIETRTVVFNEKLLAFARHWGFRPKACAPYRARTKGKTERGVGYVKRNAIAGRSFASWEALEAHLARWEREIANVRVHGTTGETPAERFERAEAGALKPLAGRPPFRACRTLVRRVKGDCVVEVDGNAYSVPWRLIGETVEVTVVAGPGSGRVRVRHGTREVAVHAVAPGKRQRVIDAAHLEGVAGAPGTSGARPSPAATDPPSGACATMPTLAPPPALLRPLVEYEAAVRGGF
jgi:Mu transposase-like protein/DDE family transposase